MLRYLWYLPVGMVVLLGLCRSFMTTNLVGLAISWAPCRGDEFSLSIERAFTGGTYATLSPYLIPWLVCVGMQLAVVVLLGVPTTVLRVRRR